MTHYLIEYRFQGKAKSEIKQMIFDLDKKFHLGFVKSKKIPHISFAGPLATNDETRLIKDFISLCKNTQFCSFKVDGFGFFERTKVVYINIIPSEKLEKFRWALSQKIMKYCTLRDFDYKKDFEFHATLAMKLDDQNFLAIKRYIEHQNSPQFKHFLIRATIIKNSRILCEYDFLQRRVLTREEALSRGQLAITMKLLNDFFEGNYDPNQNLNKTNSQNNSKNPIPNQEKRGRSGNHSASTTKSGKKTDIKTTESPKSKKGGIVDKIKKVLNNLIK
jgi:hypothetical protein